MSETRREVEIAVADAPVPENAGSKAGSAAPKGDDSGSAAEEQPPKSDDTLKGRSIASVVASERLTTLADAIATTVKHKAAGRPIVVVEDRTVAESALPLLEVEATLTSCQTLLTVLDQAVADAPHPPPPPARHVTRLVEDEGEGEPDVGEAGGAAETDVGGEAGTEGTGTATTLSPLETAKGVADVLKLFASTIAVTPQDVQVDRTALAAAVAGRIKHGHVRWPSSSGLLTAAIFGTASDVATHVLRLSLAVDELETSWSPINTDLDRRRARLKEITAKRDAEVAAGHTPAAKRLLREQVAEQDAIADLSTRDLARAMAAIRTARAGIAAIGTRFDAINTPGSNGRTRLQAAAMRQHLETVAGKDDWAALWVDSTGMGGDRVDRSSPLGWSSEVGYVAGAQVMYLLVAKDGSLLASDASTRYGFRVFDFASVSGGVGEPDPWRPPRLLNIELLEILAVIVVLVILLLMLQVIFKS